MFDVIDDPQYLLDPLTISAIVLYNIVPFALFGQPITGVGHDEGDLREFYAARQFVVKLVRLCLGKDLAHIVDHLALLVLAGLLALHRSHELCYHLRVFLQPDLATYGCLD